MSNLTDPRSQTMPPAIQASLMRRTAPITWTYATALGPRKLKAIRHLIRDGESGKAIDEITDTPEWERDPSARLQYGRALFSQGDYGSALAEDREAKSLLLRDLVCTASTNIAGDLFMLKRYAEAEEEVAFALSLRTDWAAPWVVKLCIYAFTGRNHQIASLVQEMDDAGFVWQQDAEFIDSLQSDPHLVSLRKHPSFRAIFKEGNASRLETP